MLDYKLLTVRPAAILTNSFVAGTVLGLSASPETAVRPSLQNQIILYVDFTKGSLTSAEIKVEFSDDNSDYYQECLEDASTNPGTIATFTRTLTATGKYRIAIPIKDSFVKVSAQGTGTVTSSSMKILAVVGTA